MAKMKLSEYRKTFAPGSRPAINTLKARIDRKELRGGKEGKMWYVETQPVEPELSDRVRMVLGA